MLPVEETKICERCKKTFTRRQGSYIIAPKAWPTRRFCSEQCRRAAMGERVRGAGEAHPAHKGGEAGRSAGNARARKLYPELGSCERCGEPAELRHHIDENTLNNEPENIEFLCRPCHVRHHEPVEARYR